MNHHLDLDGKVVRGLRRLRELALGKGETRNPDLPDRALGDLEHALRWMDRLKAPRARRTTKRRRRI